MDDLVAVDSMKSLAHYSRIDESDRYECCCFFSINFARFRVMTQPWLAYLSISTGTFVEAVTG